jgi:hypothetical protein
MTSAPSPRLPPPAAASPTEVSDPEGERKRRLAVIGISVGALIVIAALITGAVLLFRNPATAENVRDVFIIFMALEFMLIGVALVILIVQLAVLITMLRHEVKPILDATNETLNTVRGTTAFLSENLVDPVIKLNSYLAALTQVVETLGIFGRSGRRK